MAVHASVGDSAAAGRARFGQLDMRAGLPGAGLFPPAGRGAAAGANLGRGIIRV